MAKKAVKIRCSQCRKDIFGFREGDGITVKYKDRMLRIEPGGNVTWVQLLLSPTAIPVPNWAGNQAVSRGIYYCP